MTRTEYEQIVDEIVAAEQEQLLESANAVFNEKGHSRETLVLAFAQMLTSQPAVTARIVTEILDRLGYLPAEP